jgi:hypothetical protein
MCAKLRVVRGDEPTEPIEQYIKDVEDATIDPLPYQRLMIWYRKEKMYEEELKIINKGIDALKKYYAGQQKQLSGRKINSSVKALSSKISKSMGLHDKKGNELFLPEPLPKWIQRKEVVQGKLTKAKKVTVKKKRK